VTRRRRIGFLFVSFCCLPWFRFATEVEPLILCGAMGRPSGSAEGLFLLGTRAASAGVPYAGWMWSRAIALIQRFEKEEFS
jgi:hypothetical protein